MAINHVIISDRLHTCGQPDASALGRLAGEGFELVINLAPPGVRGAVAEEAAIVAGSGIPYVNIPVDWEHPRYEDFELFSQIMNGAGDRKLLVHCQMNMRVSLFTFLYRVIHRGVEPEMAWQVVTPVWTPQDQWREFGCMVLERHGIEFDW